MRHRTDTMGRHWQAKGWDKAYGTIPAIFAGLGALGMGLWSAAMLVNWLLPLPGGAA